MKIRPDQVHGPEQEQLKNRQKVDPKESFSRMLERELGHSQEAAKGAAPPPLLGVGSLLNVQPPAKTAETERPVMQNMEHLLNEWEDYAGKLDAPGEEVDLRQAYSVLERIGNEVRAIKEQNPDLAEQNPGLKSMVDELEILAVTETIKFNRGDYY